jgi:hypothetical protein
MAGGASSEQLLGTVATQAACVFPADSAFVMRFDDDDAQCVGAFRARQERSGRDPVGRRIPLTARGPSSRVLATGNAVRLVDPSELDPEVRRVFGDDLHEAIGAPIVVADEV